jgi:hypothetical protein
LAGREAELRETVNDQIRRCLRLDHRACTAAAPDVADPQVAGKTRVPPKVASPPKSVKQDCETRMQKLDASTAEGEERLAEKDEVIGVCASQYRRDKTIGNLVNACRKYEEQPVVKQQFLAECQLAAFGYANALRALKAEYGR